MVIKAMTNELPANLKEYAFTQDERGRTDVTLGKEYKVFGIQENALGKFYLVLTDSINTKLPWWMPAQLYEVVDATIPTKWLKNETKGENGMIIEYAPADYFDNEQAIEDGEKEGYLAFENIRRDSD